MTPDELKFLKLQSQVLALESLVVGVLRGLVAAPQTREAMLAKNREIRATYANMSFPGYPPEYSDLYSAEFQEAMDSLLKMIEK